MSRSHDGREPAAERSSSVHRRRAHGSGLGAMFLRTLAVTTPTARCAARVGEPTNVCAPARLVLAPRGIGCVFSARSMPTPRTDALQGRADREPVRLSVRDEAPIASPSGPELDASRENEPVVGEARRAPSTRRPVIGVAADRARGRGWRRGHVAGALTGAMALSARAQSSRVQAREGRSTTGSWR